MSSASLLARADRHGQGCAHERCLEARALFGHFLVSSVQRHLLYLPRIGDRRPAVRRPRGSGGTGKRQTAAANGKRQTANGKRQTAAALTFATTVAAGFFRFLCRLAGRVASSSALRCRSACDRNDSLVSVGWQWLAMVDAESECQQLPRQ